MLHFKDMLLPENITSYIGGVIGVTLTQFIFHTHLMSFISRYRLLIFQFTIFFLLNYKVKTFKTPEEPKVPGRGGR